MQVPQCPSDVSSVQSWLDRQYSFICYETKEGQAYNYGTNITNRNIVREQKQVDFFWISRDQRSFEWFVSLLTNLEMEESEREQNGFERFLDFHLYMTSALRKTDMKAIGLQMALDLIHKKENRDLITGLKTRTQTGRPDWEKVCVHKK